MLCQLYRCVYVCWSCKAEGGWLSFYSMLYMENMVMLEVAGSAYNRKRTVGNLSTALITIKFIY